MERCDNLTDRRDYIADCWRILAILMVLTVHVNGYLTPTPAAINKLFSLGAYGVALYFLISGYFSYASVKNSKSIKEYAYKKAIRILPMYYLSLVCTFILDALILKDLPISWEWLYHIPFLNMFVPSQEWQWWNSVNFFWTMPAFVAWYIISPFIFKYINNAKKATLVTMCTVCITPFLKKWMYYFASEQFVNWNFFCLLYVFLFGVLAWFVIQESKKVYGILSGVGIGILGLICGNKSGFFAFGLAFYLCIVAVSCFNIRFESTRFKNTIKTLSNITYSVYLSHYFILKLCNRVISNLYWPVAYIGFIVMALGIGYVLWRFVENPVANFLRRKR